MAKRKRLDLSSPPARAEIETKSAFGHLAGDHMAARAPIADMVGASSAQAGLRDITEQVEAYRNSGQLAEPVALSRIDTEYLVRDRIALDAEDMDALKASLAERGQQMPLETVRLEDGRYGLISGWRRLRALTALHEETGEDRFARALCIVRSPNTAAEAYQSMVEENEIRAGIGFYERARIAARAAEQGAFDDTAAALKVLFAAASRSKRSKVKSFVRIYDALDTVLLYPAEISERLGLAMAGMLSDHPTFAPALSEVLSKEPPQSAAEERQRIEVVMKRVGRGELPARPSGAASEPPVKAAVGVEIGKGRIVLKGPGVTPAFQKALADWIKTSGF